MDSASGCKHLGWQNIVYLWKFPGHERGPRWSAVGLTRVEVREQGAVSSCGAVTVRCMSSFVSRQQCISVNANAPSASRLGVRVLVPVIEKLPVAPYAPTSPHPQSSATARAHEACSQVSGANVTGTAIGAGTHA